MVPVLKTHQGSGLKNHVKVCKEVKFSIIFIFYFLIKLFLLKRYGGVGRHDQLKWCPGSLKNSPKSLLRNTSSVKNLPLSIALINVGCR